MYRLSCLCILITSYVHATPSDSVALAWLDIQRIPHYEQRYIRYLSLYAVPDKLKAEFLNVLAFHVNSLSRRSVLKRPHSIHKDLVRIDIHWYSWNPTVYDKLANIDPYFHYLYKHPKGYQYWTGGKWTDGRDYPAGWYPNFDSKQVSALAPWANPGLHYQLTQLTRCKAPILRADWFFIQTAIQADRSAGYYDFLELKSRNDFFDLVGFDLLKARKRERELQAIIQKSGVAIRNRMVDQFDSLGSSHFRTRDVFKKQSFEKNAINSLNGDYIHDAEEHYGRLSNGLWAYYLSSAQGEQQDSAPDQVGPDTTSTSNDKRIHAYLSCGRCHKRGLQPLRDFGRRLFSGPGRLVSLKKDQFERFELLYLRPIEPLIDDANAYYARKLIELNGPKWTPETNAEALTRTWEDWNDSDVTVELAARELGVLTAKELINRIKYYGEAPPKGLGQLLPNTVLAFTHDPPLPMLREHFEEQYGYLQFVVRNQLPSRLYKELIYP